MDYAGLKTLHLGRTELTLFILDWLRRCARARPSEDVPSHF